MATSEQLVKHYFTMIQDSHNNCVLPPYSKPNIAITDEDIDFLLTMVDTSNPEHALEDMERLSFFIEDYCL